MLSLNVKLSPKLFDLFQHCELNCNAGCCGWAAFDLSDRWLSRWCEFRDFETIVAARSDIARIREMIADRDPETQINLERFFRPSIATLTEHLDVMDAILAAHHGDS